MVRRFRILPAAVTLLVVAGIVGGWLIRLHERCGSLGDWGNYLTGVGTILLAIAAVIAGWEAVKEYGERTKAEQMRWVGDLFGKLFQDGLYHRMRQKVDYEDLEDIVDLLKRNKDPKTKFSQDEKDKFDEFADYLNFFEFIAFLIAEKQVASDYVKQMFDYYLRRFIQIKQSDQVMEYLKKEGFENLRGLLLKYKDEMQEQEN